MDAVECVGGAGDNRRRARWDFNGAARGRRSPGSTEEGTRPPAGGVLDGGERRQLGPRDPAVAVRVELAEDALHLVPGCRRGPSWGGGG